MTSSKATFISKLKEYRQRLGLTQSQIAERVGMSVRGYQKYEQGETNPTPAQLDSFSAALGIQPWELLIPDDNDCCAWLKDAAIMLETLSHLTKAQLAAVRFLIKGHDPYFDSMTPEQSDAALNETIDLLKKIKYKRKK